MTFFDAMHLICNTSCNSHKIRRKAWSPEIYLMKILNDEKKIKICEFNKFSDAIKYDKGFCAYSEDILAEDWEEIE